MTSRERDRNEMVDGIAGSSTSAIAMKFHLVSRVVEAERNETVAERAGNTISFSPGS